jgi:hypothetical protein
MEKKLTNSGPLREPADKHSIYTIEINSTVQNAHPVKMYPDFRPPRVTFPGLTTLSL